jgi:hypothetical protein
MRSNSLILAGIVAGVLGAFWFSTIVAPGPSSGNAQPTGERQSSKSEQPQPRSDRQWPSPHQQKAPAKELECSHASQNYDDCIIQLRTARATERQADIAWNVGLVSAAALIFAAVAAGAALWTVWVMKDTAQRQLRAYLHLDPDRIFDDLRIAAGEEARGMLRFKNFGQTPAHDFVTSITTAAGPWPIPDDINLQVTPGTRNKKVVPPTAVTLKGFGYEGGGVVIPAGDFAQMRAGAIRFYIYGTAVYRDIFGKAHKTEFCFGILPPEHPGNIAGYGIERSHRHNDAD